MIRTKFFFAIILVGIIASGSIVQAAAKKRARETVSGSSASAVPVPTATAAGTAAGTSEPKDAKAQATDATDVKEREAKRMRPHVDAEADLKKIDLIIEDSATAPDLKNLLLHVIYNKDLTIPTPIRPELNAQASQIITENMDEFFKISYLNKLLKIAAQPSAEDSLFAFIDWYAASVPSVVPASASSSSTSATLSSSSSSSTATACAGAASELAPTAHTQEIVDQSGQTIAGATMLFWETIKKHKRTTIDNYEYDPSLIENLSFLANEFNLTPSEYKQLRDTYSVIKFRKSL